jgi:pyruvate dehydrogenase E1 component alpha subunit
MINYTKKEIIQILTLRYHQHLINEDLKKGKFKIPIHLAFGHEAISIAIKNLITKNDKICLTHRNVAYNLSLAENFNSVMAHFKLENKKFNSLMGSMNLSIKDKNIVYSSSILGNDLGVATGIAMNHKINNKKGIVFALTGDGAIEEGIFWETLLFIKTHKLKVVIILENNDFSMSSTTSERRAPINFKKLCESINIGYRKEKGYIYPNVKKSLKKSIVQASKGLPNLIELNIKTFNQHAGPTPGWPTDILNISLNDGLLLKDTKHDPLCHLVETLGQSKYKKISKDIIR